MKRLLSILVFIFFTSVGLVQADTILVFGQATGSNLFTGDETAGITVLDANSIPIIITTLDETASNINAFFSLDATSSASAVNVFGDVWTQSYSGSFQVTDGSGFNFLSGNFDGVQLGLDGGGTIIFGAAEPPLSIDFTSDVAGMVLNLPKGMALSLTNVLPSVSIVNGSFGDFDANVSGTFSANPVVREVPEPITLSLLGLGLVGLYRKRQAH